MKQLLLAFLLTVFAVSCQDGSVAIVESASRSVVRITAPYVSGSGSLGGSGFFVDSLGTIVTCYHVLFPRDFDPAFSRNQHPMADTSKLMLKLMNGSNLMMGNVIAVDSANDIVLIRASHDPSTLARWGVMPVGLNSPELPIKVGLEVLCLGATPLGGYGIGAGRVHGFHANRGIVSMLGENYNPQGELRPSAIVLDIQVLFGQSGGPVFDMRSGNAIGMIIGTDPFDFHGSPNDPGTTVCAPIHKIMELYRTVIVQ